MNILLVIDMTQIKIVRLNTYPFLMSSYPPKKLPVPMELDSLNKNWNEGALGNLPF